MATEIKIRISKVLVPFTFTRQVPSSWAELTPKQVKGIALPAMARSQVAIFLMLARLPIWVFRLLHDDLKANLVALVDFTQTYPRTCSVQIQGYTDMGENMDKATVFQFSWADFFFFKIAKGLDIDKSIDQLIACIFTPIGQVFSQDQIEGHKGVKSLSTSEKMAVILYFRGCRNLLVKQYKEIFNGEEETSPEGPNKSSSGPDPETMFHMINELSKSGQYGNYLQTCNTPLHIILYNKRLDLKFNKEKK